MTAIQKFSLFGVTVVEAFTVIASYEYRIKIVKSIVTLKIQTYKMKIHDSENVCIIYA